MGGVQVRRFSIPLPRRLTQSIWTDPRHSSRSASKAAMNSLGRTLGNEEKDVVIVSVRPGTPDTDMQAKIRQLGAFASISRAGEVDPDAGLHCIHRRVRHVGLGPRAIHGLARSGRASPAARAGRRSGWSRSVRADKHEWPVCQLERQRTEGVPAEAVKAGVGTCDCIEDAKNVNASRSVLYGGSDFSSPTSSARLLLSDPRLAPKPPRSGSAIVASPSRVDCGRCSTRP